MDSSDSKQDQSSCDHDDEHSGSTKYGVLLDQLRTLSLVIKNSVQWTQLVCWLVSLLVKVLNMRTAGWHNWSSNDTPTILWSELAQQKQFSSSWKVPAGPRTLRGTPQVARTSRKCFELQRQTLGTAPDCVVDTNNVSVKTASSGFGS
jgi:hypothetical protein